MAYFSRTYERDRSCGDERERNGQPRSGLQQPKGGPGLPNPFSSMTNNERKSEGGEPMLHRRSIRKRLATNMRYFSRYGDVFVFIHGGWWHFLDKSDHSCLAPPSIAKDFAKREAGTIAVPEPSATKCWRRTRLRRRAERSGLRVPAYKLLEHHLRSQQQVISSALFAALAGMLVEKPTVRDWLAPGEPAAFFGKRS
jgi:hypothetical protein